MTRRSPKRRLRHAAFMIKYLGSKRKIIPKLLEHIQSLPEIRSVADVFSGTARVGHALKQAGYEVYANDHNHYAHTLATCYVQADAQRWQEPAQKLLDELSQLPPAPGYFTQVFCEQSRFFQPHNGARIDAMREAIEAQKLDPELRAIALVALMEAADRVDSTTGVQMAYLKQWAPRAHNTLELRLPALVNGPGHAHCGEALDFVRSRSFDIVYLDPPYNSHSYLGNYHIWESLVLWDKPEVYGVACKRIDCKERKSDFNYKTRFRQAFGELIDQVRARYLLISFNNEGYIDKESMQELLRQRGTVTVYEIPYSRYVGAKIGIYNPMGERVGQVSHTKNLEYLYHVELF